jgi:L-ribulose-5-phosphate 3-epimerase
MYRRHFLKTVAAASASTCLLRSTSTGLTPPSQFNVGAITDGFSQNFEEALQVMKSYGLRWVEIRQVFGIYNTDASPAQVQQMKNLVKQYGFRVSVIDSAFYKCTLPGTKPIVSEKDTYPYSEQMEVLKRASDKAHALGTDKVRIFTFWRIQNPASVSDRIADELRKATDAAKGLGIRLVIENEEACNAATGHELAKTLAMVPAPNLGANWDVGNGYIEGEVSYPDGYNALDKKRIWHMHLKGMICHPGLKDCTECIAGQGQNDLVGQFKALLRDGYQGTMSVECEYKAPGLTHLETTKQSVAGILKAMHAAVGDKA